MNQAPNLLEISRQALTIMKMSSGEVLYTHCWLFARLLMWATSQHEARLPLKGPRQSTAFRRYGKRNHSRQGGRVKTSHLASTLIEEQIFIRCTSLKVTYMWFLPQLYPFLLKVPTSVRTLPQTALPTWNQKAVLIQHIQKHRIYR